ncbi:hypothetical protein C7959_1509 [Orenia marismortui]|uniref:Uncharacterized protein n=2 Tax=Orenia marismortui TaxID=46469 RepID=A0A4R8GH56_9FIRM|nr:hypothetical protein C7959_1509 [Orenia marismortui]
MWILRPDNQISIQLKKDLTFQLYTDIINLSWKEEYEMKTITAKINDDLHKKLRMKLLADEKTYQDLANELIELYVSGLEVEKLKEELVK